MLVIELKSEALKDRHWKQLMKRLHVSWVVSELTLGQIWDVDLQKNEAIVKDVLLVAQGEMALEEFLKQVSSGAAAPPCHISGCRVDLHRVPAGPLPGCSVSLPHVVAMRVVSAHTVMTRVSGFDADKRSVEHVRVRPG